MPVLLLLAARRTFGADDATQERQLRTFFVPAIVRGERVIDLRRAKALATRGGNRG